LARSDLYSAKVNTSRNDELTGTAGRERMATNGYRLTPQRRQVYSILLQQRDHPTANEVYFRAKQVMPDISMATVYNCLDALVECGLVRQVNLDRSATRFCPNMDPHCHFFCEKCGRIFDIDFDPQSMRTEVSIPPGFEVSHFGLALRGKCPQCASASRPQPTTMERSPGDGSPTAVKETVPGDITRVL
jgi:Fur family transcriptional regulator, peroxide stress response regulator